MAYFSNGCEGMDYVAHYCEKCVNAEQDGGCPIMDLHFAWNHEQNQDKTKEFALNFLIPRDGIRNKQCRMFRAKEVEAAR